MVPEEPQAPLPCTWCEGPPSRWCARCAQSPAQCARCGNLWLMKRMRPETRSTRCSHPGGSGTVDASLTSMHRGPAPPPSIESISEPLTSVVDEHLDFTDRGHGELARPVGQQVVSLDHALVHAGPVVYVRARSAAWVALEAARRQGAFAALWVSRRDAQPCRGGGALGRPRAEALPCRGGEARAGKALQKGGADGADSRTSHRWSRRGVQLTCPCRVR